MMADSPTSKPPEIILSPGWLKRDTARARARMLKWRKAWEASNPDTSTKPGGRVAGSISALLRTPPWEQVAAVEREIRLMAYTSEPYVPLEGRAVEVARAFNAWTPDKKDREIMRLREAIAKALNYVRRDNPDYAAEILEDAINAGQR